MLGIGNINNGMYVLNEIIKYLFGFQKSNKKKKIFDINLDYKYYFSDFLKYGINLNKDNIDWWTFSNILESIMLDENSTISKVISYRTYERPSSNQKIQEKKRHQFMMSMKRKYALKNQNNEDGYNKLWDILERRLNNE